MIVSSLPQTYWQWWTEINLWITTLQVFSLLLVKSIEKCYVLSRLTQEALLVLRQLDHLSVEWEGKGTCANAEKNM